MKLAFWKCDKCHAITGYEDKPGLVTIATISCRHIVQTYPDNPLLRGVMTRCSGVTSYIGSAELTS
jgi:hypothetical protein